MVTVHQAVLGLLILQIYVSAAPSELEEVAKVENEELKLDGKQSPTADSNDSSQNQRQKRFYNHFGYGYQPINPGHYSTQSKRDQSSDLGVYGIDDPLDQIHRRLQDIASVARQPIPSSPPPTPVHLPVYFPVIFVPQLGCDCTPANDNPQPMPQPSPSPQPTTKKPDGGMSPDIVNRFPEMDDERQNWGLVFNDTEDYNDNEEYSRPISFDPISPSKPLTRPAPPVEHGSIQGGAQGGEGTTTLKPSTTVRPNPPTNDVEPPAEGSAASGPYPPSSANIPREAPSICDGAVLSCCHQLHVTYDCFSVLGCPDPTSYGNPCDSLVILRVIDKFQNYYGKRTG